MLLSHKFVISQKTMTDIILHKSEQYVEEDLNYYCSDIRDKHGMIKPDENMISLTLNSKKFTDKIKGDEIASALYPFKKHSFHRIYIGLSFPLFANNWGAVFIRYLMYLVDKNGYVVLPVYAERQGVEKNYWSRTSLEDIFRSRMKWWGMSNIWAENDGVMSIRIGKKEPPKKNSSLNYLFDKYFEKLKQEGVKDQASLYNIVSKNISNATFSAIIEKIIIDYFGRKKAKTFCEIEGDGLLAAEILQSDYINITKASIFTKDIEGNRDCKKYLSQGFQKELNIVASNSEIIKLNEDYDVITMINVLNKKDDNEKKPYLNEVIQRLKKDGLLIIFNEAQESPDEALKLIPRDYEYTQYSSIVGTKLDIHKNIPHYSDLIMAELKNENQSRKNVINVFQKK